MFYKLEFIIYVHWCGWVFWKTKEDAEKNITEIKTFICYQIFVFLNNYQIYLVLILPFVDYNLCGDLKD